MKRIFLLFTFFIISSIAIAQNKYPVTITDTAILNLLKHQVLLTNLASFKEHSNGISGASAFLINYNNKIFAVTAKHLLGEGMDIQPEIKPKEIKKYLISWKMFPRIPVKSQFDTIMVHPSNLNYDALDKDIMIVELQDRKNNIFPLTPEFSLPKQGDKLYIIGCPYSQEKCRQNIYEITYDSYDTETSTLNCIIKTKVDFSGFSGAPIVDVNGHVVAALVTGWEDGKIKYVGGTFIKEIQKVK